MLTFLPTLGFRHLDHGGDCPPTYEYFERPTRLGMLHLCVKELVRFELHLGSASHPLLSWAGPTEELRRKLDRWLEVHGL